ncbi:MAG: hypothetical protein ACJAYA_001268 [Bacteroidia bacterium]|jgi:hypothetical protein
MKKILLSILILGFGYGANAQFTPAASTLPNGAINEVYAGQVINFTVPATGGVAGSVIADPLLLFVPALAPFSGIISGVLAGQSLPFSISNTTLSVSGLPSGVIATCDATPCTYTAGSTGTITLSGTPDVGGTFSININTLTNGDADLSAIASIGMGLIPSTFALPQSISGVWDEEGYSMMISDPAGIAESNEVFSLGLYPNPTEGISTLDVNSTIAGIATVEVYSITGSLVQTSAKPIRVGANRLSLDFSSVPAGIYLVKADINGHQALVRTQKK